MRTANPCSEESPEVIFVQYQSLSYWSHERSCSSLLTSTKRLRSSPPREPKKFQLCFLLQCEDLQAIFKWRRMLVVLELSVWRHVQTLADSENGGNCRLHSNLTRHSESPLGMLSCHLQRLTSTGSRPSLGRSSSLWPGAPLKVIGITGRTCGLHLTIY